MSRPARRRIPLYLILLDFTGSILVGIGLLLKFGDAAADIIPPAFPLRDDPDLIIVIGLAMLLPLIKYILKINPRRNPQK